MPTVRPRGDHMPVVSGAGSHTSSPWRSTMPPSALFTTTSAPPFEVLMPARQPSHCCDAVQQQQEHVVCQSLNSTAVRTTTTPNSRDRHRSGLQFIANILTPRAPPFDLIMPARQPSTSSTIDIRPLPSRAVPQLRQRSTSGHCHRAQCHNNVNVRHQATATTTP